MTSAPSTCAAVLQSASRHGQPLARGKIPALAPFALAVLLASASFWMFTRNNDFPLDYHPDERGKVLQVIDPAQSRNFNHPLLMLETANAARILFHVPNDERAIAISGRWTSAGLAAIAALAFAMAGYCAGGYRGLLVCGSMAALCPALDVYAHFFKEDTSLVAGLAIAMLGASWLVATDRRWNQRIAIALMGVGCGAAISGKYIGVAAVLPCLVAIFLAPTIKRRSLSLRAFAFALAVAASIVVSSFRAFESFFPPRLVPVASRKIVEEFLHATTGHDGLTLAVPNSFSVGVATSEMMPHVWLFIALGTVLLVSRRLWNRPLAITAAFLATFAVTLSFSAFPFPRYALPLTMFGYFVAGQLITAVLVQITQPRWLNWAAFVIVLGVILAAQGTRIWRFNTQFADDSRQRLREWVARNLGNVTTLLVEDFTVLDGAGDPWRHPDQSRIQARILRAGSIADRALTIDQLRMAGIDYVVVAEPKYERYFRPGTRAVLAAQQEDFMQHQRLYRELFAHTKLVWASKPSPPSHAYVNPELRVYHLSETIADATPETPLISLPRDRPTAH
jgi:hypothetical protein